LAKVVPLALVLACVDEARPPRTPQPAASYATQRVAVDDEPLESDRFDPSTDPDLTTLREVGVRLTDLSERSSSLVEALRREMVWLQCGAGRLTCGLITQLYSDDSFVADFSKSECNEPFGKSRKKLSAKCQQKYFDAFTEAVLDRYAAGDPRIVDQVCAEDPSRCRDMGRYELVWLKAHNDAVIAQFERKRAGLEAARTAALTEGEAARRRFAIRQQAAECENQRVQRARRRELLELQSRIQQAEPQPEVDEARRAVIGVAAGIAAAMKAGADTLAGPGYSPSPGRSCSSDYDCGAGSHCSKRYGLLDGVCARSVDRHGAPSAAPPNPASFGPAMAQCTTMASCPMGFRCDGGQCVQ
jgi:hypothetical protein